MRVQTRRTTDNAVVTDTQIRLGMQAKKKSFIAHPDSFCRSTLFCQQAPLRENSSL
jgi:hypothetical protein